MLACLDETDRWDVLVIGGGATGLGVAVEAASRGLRTLLVEQHDFAKGTSSRSTKLAHGGVRYLEQGRVGLVLEALRERGRLRANAPHLVHRRPFVVPCYRWWAKPYYGLGLKLYDLLATGHRFGRSRLLSREETLRHLPTIASEGLRGGVLYYDGQFNDARLAINLARTAVEQGATVINYLRVTDLIGTGRGADASLSGAVVRDRESGREHRLQARTIINATGVFADDVRRMDDPEASPLLRPSQGTHLVLDRSFLPGESAMMIPRTDDGRVLFAIPWLDRVIVGTTDAPTGAPVMEPDPTVDELEFLLNHAARYLKGSPGPEDVRSVFAGLRPLVDTTDTSDTSELSRSHTLCVSPRGLITITGGKWTTYRQMAEDTIDCAVARAGLEARPSSTKTLRLHGWHDHADTFGALQRYGAEAPALRRLMRRQESLAAPLHPDLPFRKAEVVWAARHEMARTVEDVLARRTPALFINAEASIEAAPDTARLLARELDREASWTREQVQAFQELAAGYRMPTTLPAAV